MATGDFRPYLATIGASMRGRGGASVAAAGSGQNGFKKYRGIITSCTKTLFEKANRKNEKIGGTGVVYAPPLKI